MNSLLGLNYYDDEDDEQQKTEKDGNTAKPIKAISAPGLSSLVSYKDDDQEGDEEEEGNEASNGLKNSAYNSQAIVHNDTGGKQSKEESIKPPPPTILLPKKALAQSPDFSNLVRRKDNNPTPHKRDGLSASPKQVVSSPVVNILSPHQKAAEPVEQQKSDTGDNISTTPMETDTQFDESDYANRQVLMRQLLTPKPIEGKDNWGIPPEPEKECDQDLQAKIVHFYQLKERGVHFNKNLLKNKAFRNPHIYNKLVEFVELDEIGSNFDREVYDPYGFPPEAFADQLAEVQKRIAEERTIAQQQQQRSQIQFVGSSNTQNISKARHVMQSLAARAERGSSSNSVTAKSTSITSTTSTINTTSSSIRTLISRTSTSTSGRKRASKWDVPAPEAIASSSKTNHSSSSSSTSSRHTRRNSRDRDRERERERERERDRDRDRDRDRNRDRDRDRDRDRERDRDRARDRDRDRDSKRSKV